MYLYRIIKTDKETGGQTSLLVLTHNQSKILYFMQKSDNYVIEKVKENLLVKLLLSLIRRRL